MDNIYDLDDLTPEAPLTLAERLEAAYGECTGLERPAAPYRTKDYGGDIPADVA